jgi:CheY-like chemotaxis protein
VAHTLLLADDSVTIQRVIELTFADEDVRVVAVSDGDQAIAALDAHPPDIVLADVGMPGKNGYEVARHIKGSPRLAHIPVVLLTGAFEPVDQAAAAEVGCDGVLAKPFEPQMVIGRVRELLARSRAAGAPPAGAPPRPSLDVPVPAAPAAEPLPPQAPPLPAVAEYFDRLDQAFAGLSTAPRSEPAETSPVPAEMIDWFGTSEEPAAGPPVDVDAWAITPEPAADAPLEDETSHDSSFWAAEDARVPLASDAQEAPPPAPRAPAATFPPLADAFAALLAAERSAPTPAAAPVWPASAPAAAPAVIDDEVIEEVARRVMERLTDRVVRETVAGIATSVAERLIREEIERIKSALK